MAKSQQNHDQKSKSHRKSSKFLKIRESICESPDSYKITQNQENSQNHGQSYKIRPKSSTENQNHSESVVENGQNHNKFKITKRKSWNRYGNHQNHSRLYKITESRQNHLNHDKIV